jgi:hypothetical protein
VDHIGLFLVIALFLAACLALLVLLYGVAIINLVAQAFGNRGLTARTRVAERLARLAAAVSLARDVPTLVAALAECPSGWRALRVDPLGCSYAPWDDAEFVAFVAHRRTQSETAVTRAAPSYSRMCFELAALACGRGDWPTAQTCAERGLALEPDHPLLWCARGVALEGQGQPGDALECYRAGATQRAWSAAHSALAQDAARALEAELAQAPGAR